jgi:hypothetical protein
MIGGSAGEVRLQAVYTQPIERFALYGSLHSRAYGTRRYAHGRHPVHWRSAGFSGASQDQRNTRHGLPILHARRDGCSVILGKSNARNRRPAPAYDATHEEAYRLLTIEPVRTPEGCTGRDWHLYRISQGANLITGYRQGDLRAATAEVERIVVGLNERRVASKGRPGPKPKGAPASAAAPAAAPEGDDAAT